MPCMDCIYWARPPHWEQRQRSVAGYCHHDNREAHANYHCGSWRRRQPLHNAVGLTAAECGWAFRNPGNHHIRALNQMFHRLEKDPENLALRRDFADRLKEWRRA